ncbi:metal ABC transporter substrate-binding protein [Sulfurimonas sp. MAG313]|nr:metal ABC transporter substrate-binding protein [Sulfurimonas sp. MAG313]MDF1881082.1 metal ABC transporter substrate-binding protein [Sulfurimonas sp. MAG313]
MKKNLIIVVLLVLIVFIIGSTLLEKKVYSSNQAFIAVTNFPLYEISSKLLRDKIDIEKLIPFGVEAHAYTPSVKTMIQVSKAELFIYSGLGMEPWITQNYDNALNMSEYIELQEMSEKHHHENAHQDEQSDPHYWLDFENMIRMTLVLSDSFEKKFPELQNMIKNNSKAYIEDLKILQKNVY